MNESMKLFVGLSYVNARYIDEALDSMTTTKDSRAKKRRRGLKSALIAAVITAMLVALGAAAYALGNMWSKGLHQQLSATGRNSSSYRRPASPPCLPRRRRESPRARSARASR